MADTQFCSVRKRSVLILRFAVVATMPEFANMATLSYRVE